MCVRGGGGQRDRDKGGIYRTGPSQGVHKRQGRAGGSPESALARMSPLRTDSLP